MLRANQIYQNDALRGFKEMDAKSIHTIVTSPPYFGLRDYDVPPMLWPEVSYSPMAGIPAITVPEWTGCLGLEPTPEMYVGHMVAIFRKARQALRDDGTLWINLGDTYSGSGRGYGDTKTTNKGNPASKGVCAGLTPDGIPSKNLMGIPWRVAFALQADGWYYGAISSGRNPTPCRRASRTAAPKPMSIFSCWPNHPATTSTQLLLRSRWPKAQLLGYRRTLSIKKALTGSRVKRTAR